MLTLVLIVILLIYGSSTSSSSSECNDFFTIMSSKMPWKDTATADDTCSNSLSYLKTRLDAANNQMGLMNSTLTVYTTYNTTDCGIDTYVALHNNIKFEIIDTVSLLNDYGFQSSLSRMKTWNITGYTRSSDILRILIQHKYKQTYMDLDIHYIDLNRMTYFVPFTSVCIWQEYENSIEISNSAFCLPNDILNDMIKYLKARITLGSDKFHYAELGPAMFRQILLNHNTEVHMYSQNHPKVANISSILESIKKFNHKLLHFTTSIRKEYRHNYQYILERLRSINLETLSSDYDYSYKYNNQPLPSAASRPKSRIRRSKSSDNDKTYIFEANIYNKTDDDLQNANAGTKNEKGLMLKALEAIVIEEEGERYGLKLDKKADAKAKADYAMKTKQKSLYEKKLQRSGHKKRHQEFFNQLAVNE